MSQVRPLPELKLIFLVPKEDLPDRFIKRISSDWNSRYSKDNRIRISVDDTRWTEAQEFLNYAKLAPKSRQKYEIELRRFLSWTDMSWYEIGSQHVHQYKAFLESGIQTRKGKALSPNSINDALFSS